MRVYGELKYMMLEQVAGISALTGVAASGRMIQDTSGALANPLFYDNTQWRNILLGPTGAYSSPLTVAANLFYGGPSSGTAAYPAFRGIAAADLPGTVFPGQYTTSRFYPSSTSNYWTVTSTSYSNFTVVGTIPFSSNISDNIGCTKATSNLPGLSFTAPRTGTIRITATALVASGSSVWATLRLYETGTGDFLAQQSVYVYDSTVACELIGYLPVTSGTAYNLNIEGKASAADAVTIAYGSADTGLSFDMMYIT